jgi:pyridoxamine---pyruvate transaminase
VDCIVTADRAWRHIAANPNAPRGSALSILDWRDAHRPERAFPFTPPVSEIYALRSVLRQYLAEGRRTSSNATAGRPAPCGPACAPSA